MGRTGVVGWLRKRMSPLIFWAAGSHEEPGDGLAEHWRGSHVCETDKSMRTGG
jgi:hypothetical protein